MAITETQAGGMFIVSDEDARKILLSIATSTDILKSLREIGVGMDYILRIRMIFSKIKSESIERFTLLALPDSYKPAVLSTLSMISIYGDGLSLLMPSYLIEFRDAIDLIYSTIERSSDVIAIFFYIYYNIAQGMELVSSYAKLVKDILDDAMKISRLANSLKIYIDDAMRHIESGGVEGIRYLTTYAVVSFIVKSYLLSAIYNDKGLFDKILRAFMVDVDRELINRGLLRTSGLWYGGSEARVGAYIFKI